MEAQAPAPAMHEWHGVIAKHRAIRRLRSLALALPLVLITSTVQAATQYKPDNRQQLPPEINHTYMGLSAGYTNIPFSNNNLLNGFTANYFNNPTYGLSVFIGHFFNGEWGRGVKQLSRPRNIDGGDSGIRKTTQQVKGKVIPMKRFAHKTTN